MSKGTRTHTQNIPSGARGAPWLAGPLPLLQATPDLGAGRAMDRLPSAAGSEGALRVRHQSVSLQKNMEHLGKKGGGAGRCLYVFFSCDCFVGHFSHFCRDEHSLLVVGSVQPQLCLLCCAFD